VDWNVRPEHGEQIATEADSQSDQDSAELNETELESLRAGGRCRMVSNGPSELGRTIPHHGRGPTPSDPVLATANRFPRCCVLLWYHGIHRNPSMRPFHGSRLAFQQIACMLFGSTIWLGGAHAQRSPALDPVASLSLRDAVRSALRRHPGIARARSSVAAAVADVRAAAAPFDLRLNGALGLSHDTQYLLPAERYAAEERTLSIDRTSATLGAAAGLQWGMTLSPSVALERVDSSRDPNPAVLPTAPFQRARVELSVVQALLRGGGTVGAASALWAAQGTVEATKDDEAHETQTRVFEAIAAYYQFVAAVERVAGYRDSVARAERLLEKTRLLVAAEHRTPSDVRQVQAGLERQTYLLLAAEDDLVLARFELALAMGLDGADVPDWSPADRLPSVSAPALQAEHAVRHALSARRDLRSAAETLRAADTRVSGAERNALPALDLGVTVGYVGALDRDGVGPFFGALASNVPGVNAGATLTLELPVGNDAAGALLDLRRAERQSARIARDDVARRIRVGVRRALASLQLSAAAGAAAARAVELSTQLVEDERAKLSEGLATTLDVVLTEERLTQAQLALTASQLRHAVARARFCFESGALPERERDVPASADDLLQLGMALPEAHAP
jgi:outer membrane protein TolC